MRTFDNPLTVTPNAASARSNTITIVALTLLLTAAYLSTMLAGVEHGDAAQIQYMSALLGVCHPPGYATEVLAGWLFSRIPIGPGVAWRINLLMVICGVAGCLALYGAVRRITGRITPGLVAATLLGFSSIYWHYSLLAEAYVFYGMFLLLGVYAAVRFVESNRAAWLYLTAIALGICVAGRPSELFVLPGFLAAWWVYKRRAPLRGARLAVSALLFVLPFLFSVGYIMARANAEGSHTRDNAASAALVAVNEDDDASFRRRLTAAVYHALGLKWASDAGFSADELRDDLSRYARLLSGREIVTRPGPPAYGIERNEGFGVSISAVGVALAVLACVWRRRDYGWTLLGAGLFLGNLVFYVWHHRWDGLTFTIPGLAGLAFLAGLAVAGPRKSPRAALWRRCAVVAGVVTSLALLATNYPRVDRTGPDDQKQREIARDFKALPWPQDCAILSIYWEATRYRYLLHVEAGRNDIRVLNVKIADMQAVAEGLKNDGVAIFLSPRYRTKLDPRFRRAAKARTPPIFNQAGLLMLYPGNAPPNRPDSP